VSLLDGESLRAVILPAGRILQIDV